MGESAMVVIAGGIVATVQVLTVVLQEWLATKRAARLRDDQRELVRHVSGRPPVDELTLFLSEQCDRCGHMRNTHVPRKPSRRGGSAWSECAWLELHNGEPCPCAQFVEPDRDPTPTTAEG